MSPSHLAALSALASAVVLLKKSKSKDAKAILEALAKNHEDALSEAADYANVDVDVVGGDLDATALVQCMSAMGITWPEVMAGAVPCIIEGRYAVRTKDGLKLGPAVS